MGHEQKRFGFQAKQGEMLDFSIKMKDEKRAIVHGTVYDDYDKPVEDAAVILLKQDYYDPCKSEIIYSTFTDDCGQFVFGPVDPDKDYAIKVWADGANLIELSR